MDAMEIFKIAGKNEFSRWSFDDVERNRDANLAINRIGQDYFVPKFTPKFKVPVSSNFFTIGSCFAREIETALMRIGVPVSSRISEIGDCDLFHIRKGVTTIFDFFNRYNVPSITREVENISGRNNMWDSDALFYEVGEGLYDDLHYTAAVESANLETLRCRRRWIGERSSAAYRAADVVVITLGLSEAWYDNASGHYLNVLSSPAVARRYRDSLSVKVVNFGEAHKQIQRAMEIIEADGKRVILTVSPVPLQITYFDRDIVLSNFEAKCILRSVCSAIASEYEGVDYFPSFEMVHFSAASCAWKADGRHVQMPMVEKIMSSALGAYLE